MHRLYPGVRTPSKRKTGSSVYVVYHGTGRSIINGVSFEWGQAIFRDSLLGQVLITKRMNDLICSLSAIDQFSRGYTSIVKRSLRNVRKLPLHLCLCKGHWEARKIVN